jgi:flagellar hook assembly protein FlgD
MKQIFTNLFYLFVFQLFVYAESDSLLIKQKNNQIDKIAISQVQKIQFENLTSVNVNNQSIKNLQLSGNFPNPFSDLTNIEFEIAGSGNVEVNIFDIQGKQIQNLKYESCQVGKNSIQWNCLDENQNRVQSGTYFMMSTLEIKFNQKKCLLLNKWW